MKKTTKYSFFVIALVVATAANAYSTKVKITKAPDFSHAGGKGLLVSTNKGTVAIEKRIEEVYSAFKDVKPGTCFILETESESTVEFNKPLGQSGTMTATKTKC